MPYGRDIYIIALLWDEDKLLYRSSHEVQPARGKTTGAGAGPRRTTDEAVFASLKLPAQTYHFMLQLGAVSRARQMHLK